MKWITGFLLMVILKKVLWKMLISNILMILMTSMKKLKSSKQMSLDGNNRLLKVLKNNLNRMLVKNLNKMMKMMKGTFSYCLASNILMLLKERSLRQWQVIAAYWMN